MTSRTMSTMPSTEKIDFHFRMTEQTTSHMNNNGVKKVGGSLQQSAAQLYGIAHHSGSSSNNNNHKKSQQQLSAATMMKAPRRGSALQEPLQEGVVMMKAPRRGSALQEGANRLYGVGNYGTTASTKYHSHENDDTETSYDDEYHYNYDDSDDDDDSDDSDDDMLQRALRNATMSSCKGGSSLKHNKLAPLQNYQSKRNDDDDYSESSVSVSGTDYGYDDDDDFGRAEEEQQQQHFLRRNSCLINKRQSLLNAVLESGDSMLGMGSLGTTEGPPRLSDRDLQYEQQRKADLVIAMYNR